MGHIKGNRTYLLSTNYVETDCNFSLHIFFVILVTWNLTKKSSLQEYLTLLSLESMYFVLTLFVFFDLTGFFDSYPLPCMEPIANRCLLRMNIEQVLF